MELVPVEVAAAIRRATYYYQSRVDNAVLAVTTNYAARAALARAGFTLDIHQHSPDEASLEVRQDELVAVYRVLGRLSLSGYEVLDTRRRQVAVKLTPAGFPGITVKYQRKLPRGSKCRIEKVKRSGFRSYSTPEVVCGV